MLCGFCDKRLEPLFWQEFAVHVPKDLALLIASYLLKNDTLWFTERIEIKVNRPRGNEARFLSPHTMHKQMMEVATTTVRVVENQFQGCRINKRLLRQKVPVRGVPLHLQVRSWIFVPQEGQNLDPNNWRVVPWKQNSYCETIYSALSRSLPLCDVCLCTMGTLYVYAKTLKEIPTRGSWARLRKTCLTSLLN